MVRMRSLLLLIWVAASPRVAHTAEPPTAEDGYRLLEGGRAAEAGTVFVWLTVRNPGDPTGWAGLTWSRLAEGRVSEAVRAAERWVRLDPEGEDARRALLVVLAADPARRADAITANEDWLASHPDDQDAALRLAHLHLADGRTAEAESVLSAFLEAHPEAVEPRLLRGRMRGWRGMGLTARRDLAGAEARAPDHPGVKAARSLLELSLGREGAAQAWLVQAEALDPSDPLAEIARDEVRDATSPGLEAVWTIATETSGIDRWTLTGTAFGRPHPATRLEARPEIAWFRGVDDEVYRVGLEVRVVQELPADLDLDASARAQWVAGEAIALRGAAELVWSPAGLLRTSLGARRRAMVDEPIVEGTALPPLVGTAGAGIEQIREGLHLDELFLRGSGAPVPGSYAYLEATLGRVGDGNRRRSVSTGAGYDLLHRLPEVEHHALYLRYELFWAAFREDVPDYYSPPGPGEASHAPGVEWHWGVEGRYRFVGLAAPILLPGGPMGRLVGASATLWLARRTRASLGVRHQGNLYYQISGIDLRFDGRL